MRDAARTPDPGALPATGLGWAATAARLRRRDCAAAVALLAALAGLCPGRGWAATAGYRDPGAPAGGGALPALGDAGDMTPLQERKLGDRIIRELYRDPDYVDDPPIGEYVDGIWRALRAAGRQRGEITPELDERYAWVFVLGHDRTINAFALPGGYMGRNLGLIGAVSSRDELASVLGHEQSHITQRHIARLLGKQERQTPLMLAAMVAGLLAGMRNPQAGAALAMGGQAAVVRQQLSFSRTMEREADRVGYAVMTQAGFAPQGFVSMFEKLQRAARLDDNGDWPFLRTHPLTTERIADMQQRQQRLGPQPPPPTDWEALLLAARARVLGNPGVDVLRAWAGEPDQPGFAGQPAPERAAALYAAALSQSQLRDLPRARALAARVAPLLGGDARGLRQARLLQAELALADQQPRQALELLAGVSAAAPGAPRDAASQAGRALLLLRSRAQLQSGQPQAAAAALQTWVADHPDDAGAWTALAGASEALGQRLRALRAEGEAQFAQRDLQGAIDRWRAAQDFSRTGRASAGDLIEASIVDTRLRQAREQLKLQQDEERKQR